MTELEPSTLRILNAKGQTIGTGFLVSKTLAVTCAHVAMAASPDGENRIRAQFTGQKQPITAKVLDQFLDLERDVAILELESVPDGIQPLRLGLAAQCQSGNPFYSFGYTTAAKIQGIIARGAIDGYLPQHQLLQLQAPQADHGISGAPVLDEKRGVVVGMITKGHTELGRNQETTFATPAELIFEVCPEIRPSETCPYLGLEAFTAESAQFFFGREALTEKLLGVLRGGCRFLAVFGPSGSGKSSVVKAGLLPALAKGRLNGSQKWAQVTIRPADDPCAQMKALSLGLRDIDGYLRRHPGMERLVLFVDQFEELFTLCPDELRDGFVRDLAAALENSRLILILSMRDDFYSAFNAKAAPLAGSTDKTVVDVPVTLERADLIAMIERPAAAVGLALEEGLTDAIIKDATTDGAARSATLPLLEFALTQLWEQRRDGLLTHEAYQSIGGVTGSLARWADDAYSTLPKDDQPLAESLLTALVHLGDESQGLPDTRRRRALAEFDEPTRRVIKHFADRRLLVTAGETVELVHDALVREWGRLQGWIKHDRDNLRLREAVNDAARQWEMGGKDESLLYRGWRLNAIVSLSSKHSLNVLENAFIAASIAAERRQRFQRIGFGLAIAALFIIFVVLGPGQWAYHEYQRLKVISESPLVKVGIFNIESAEVTNIHYGICVDANFCEKPKYDPPKQPKQLDLGQNPVVFVTFDQAQKYCAWLGRRLPTSDEWGRAVRGQEGRLWPWGNTPPTPDNANIRINLDSEKNLWSTPAGTLPVASFQKGATPDGIYDLVGNVWEWTSTQMGNSYIQRGGAWDSVIYQITDTRSSVGSQPDQSVGFRCASQ